MDTSAAALPGEVVRAGSLRVALPPEQAFELFTAAGEVHWAPGWRPRYVTPPDGSPVPGGIWLTGEGRDEVIWRVERFDRTSHHAEYLRVTPASRVAVVQVRCEADGAHSLVSVTYRVIALTDDGRRWLEGFTAESYAGMMREWEGLIAGYLASAG